MGAMHAVGAIDQLGKGQGEERSATSSRVQSWRSCRRHGIRMWRRARSSAKSFDRLGVWHSGPPHGLYRRTPWRKQARKSWRNPSIDFAKSKLDRLEAAQLRRRLAETARADGVWLERGGRRLLSFSCNDYLGLTHHPKVKAAAIAATERYGAGAGASRLVTGNHPLFAELEARLAALKGSRGGLHLRLGLSGQCRHHPDAAGRGRSSAGRRAGPCLHLGRGAAVARAGGDVPAQRCRPCARDSGARIAPRTAMR